MKVKIVKVFIIIFWRSLTRAITDFMQMEKETKKPPNHSLLPAFCFSPPVNHTSICPPTACVQFQDHDFILGCLADFPAVLLEEFLAEKNFVSLSVFSQAQLTKFLPAKPNKTRQRKRTKLKLAQKWNNMLVVWVYSNQENNILSLYWHKLKIYSICMCVCKNR